MIFTPHVHGDKLRWIIGADAVHHMFLGKCTSATCVCIISSNTGQFKKEYPEAKLVAVDEAVKKKAKEGLEFHGGKPFAQIS